MTTTSIALPDAPEYRDPTAWTLQEARRILKEILAGTGVRARLFGSRARGNARPFSDLDIALSAGEEAVSGALMARLSEAFEASRIPPEVDLVDLQSASPDLRRAVEEEGAEWIA